MMASKGRLAVVSLLMLSLAACGGDGGGGGSEGDRNEKVDFGDVTVGLTRENRMSIGTNGGSIRIDGLPVLLPPFSIKDDDCSFKIVATSCSFTIRFAPISVGSFSHNFEVPSDAANKLTFFISGKGIASGAGAPPPSVPPGGSPPPVAGWTGTKQFGTASDDEAKSVAVDANGNVYVAGITLGGLDGNTYLGGDGDAFVVKYSAAGVRLWTRQFGTTFLDRAFGVAVDANDNVYVAGQTWGSLHGNIFAGGDGDAFVVKLDAAGARQWTKQIGTIGGDSINGVAVDANGNLYVAGGAGGSLGGNTYAGGDADAFVAKYDALGDEQWLQQFGAGDRDVASSVAVDAGGNVHVVGEVRGSLHGSAHVGGTDAFVAKYDATGMWLWTNVFGARVGVFGTSSFDVAYSVAVDTHGNVYVGGQTTGALDGDTTGGNHALGSMGDGFVVKYDATGASQWIRQLGTGLTDAVYGVAVDTLGGVYLSGRTSGGLGGNKRIGFDDAFVMKYDAAGVRFWTRQLGNRNTYAYGVVVSTTGHVFAAGATNFGLNGNSNAGDIGSFDAFVVKYDTEGGG